MISCLLNGGCITQSVLILAHYTPVLLLSSSFWGECVISLYVRLLLLSFPNIHILSEGW